MGRKKRTKTVRKLWFITIRASTFVCNSLTKLFQKGLCNYGMSQVVLFAYAIKLNNSTKNRVIKSAKLYCHFM